MSEGQIRRSSKVLVAEYIASVGEGNRFTKLDLAKAVPGFSQVDRRMRDLRECGWVIDNYKVNSTLKPDEYLVQQIGVRVDLGERPPTSGRKSIGGAKRRRIFERDGNLCVICGMPAGKPFPDAPERLAVLTIGHVVPVARGGTDDDSNLRAECQRCGDESRDNTIDPPTAESVLTQATNVGGRAKKVRLLDWMVQGQRAPDDIERVFIEWRRLPRDAQEDVKKKFSTQVSSAEVLD